MSEESVRADSTRVLPEIRYPWGVRAAVGVLLAAGLALRLWLIFGVDVVAEDSLITLRYAKNLWGGEGLVYNPGEKVLGFTSPLWTFITAPIVGLLPIGAARIALMLTCLLLYAVAVALLLRLAPRGFRLGSWGVVVLAGLLSLEPRLAIESVSGMEMSLFVLWIAASLWAVRAGRLYWAFAFASASFLTRPEGAIFWAVLFLYVAALPDRRFKRLPLKESIVPSAAIVLPWLAFATLYYGSPIPQSATSKSMWGAEGLSLRELLFRPTVLDGVWRSATGLYVHKLPGLGRGLLALGGAALWSLACYSAYRTRQGLILATQGFFAALILFYYLGGGHFFPWYAVTTIVLFALAWSVFADFVVEGIAALARRTFGAKYKKPLIVAYTVLASIVLAGSVPVMTGRVTPSMNPRFYEKTVYKSTGEYLRDCTPEEAVAMVEPIGYIGFFSERRIMDLAGIVSPDFRPTPEKIKPGWGARQILQYEPQYLILRAYEVPENKFYVSLEAPMFSDESQRAEFARKYVEGARFDFAPRPDLSLVIYRRSDAPILC